MLSNPKSGVPGSDDNHNAMLNHLPPEELDTLLYIYNKSMATRLFPEQYLMSTVNPLPKPGKTQLFSLSNA